MQINTKLNYSPVAQSVEQLAVNQLVAGSSPAGGVFFYLRLSDTPGYEDFRIPCFTRQLQVMTKQILHGDTIFVRVS